MVNRRTFAVLAAIGAIAAANLVTACVRSDDQDTFATPTPPAQPTPIPLHHCQVVWTAQDAVDPTTVDALVLDGSRELWVNGPAVVATDAAAGFAYYFLEGVTLGAGAAAQPDLTSAIAFAVGGTGETFTISGMNINGTASGSPVTITDSMAHPAYGLDTNGAPDPTSNAGTLGPASFDGNFTDYSGTFDVSTTDMATATITSDGTYTLGGFGSYAACYDIPQ